MKFFLILLMSASTSFAGFKMGKYVGQDKNGADCEITFHITSYINAVKNPVNEEIYASLPGHRKLFVLTHIPSLDNFTGAITVEKNAIREFTGTKNGATALSVQIVNGYVSHVPGSYSFTVHDWKKNVSTSDICSNLQLAK